MVSAAQVKPDGVIGNIACPIAVNAALALVTTQIPSSWGCTPGSVTTDLSTALTAACVAAVPFKKVIVK